MPYITETPRSYNPAKKDYTIDLPRFAQDLAKHLNGTATPLRSDYPDRLQLIQIGNDELHLTFDEWKKRVCVSISASDVKPSDYSSHDKAQRTDDANVNPDGRSIAAIANDIKRRVIDANQSALAARRAHAAIQVQRRANIAKHVAALKQAPVSLDIRHRDGEQMAQIYSGGCGKHHIDATLSSDNTVDVKRLGSMSAKTFAKIVALLEANNTNK